MKTYTYNKSTVWFLSTPIQNIALCATAFNDEGGFFLPIFLSVENLLPQT
jgi:hypothetical protein